MNIVINEIQLSHEIVITFSDKNCIQFTEKQYNELVSHIVKELCPKCSCHTNAKV
jgi:hypothetical protein